MRIDVRVNVQLMVTFENHRNFFRTRIPRTLTDTVNRHFHLTGSVNHALKCACRSHTQVVVAMG